MNKKNRALSLLLVFAMALLLIPSFGITASAAHTFSGGIVIIDEDLVDAKGNEFIIEGDVFSVTVIGDVDVSIIFNNVQIDRSADSAGTNVAGIYTAGQRLNWTRGYNSFYVPTCPLLITGGASVTARFDGNCTFKAGTSGWYATSNNINTLSLDSKNRGGYAGIQVDGDSSLTISGAENLIAYGAYQTQNSSTSAGSGKPSGLTGTNNRGGGAGIGGGTSYTSPSAATSSYTQGTPGTIIIDNGNVTAYGGFQAAGIGGGTNSAATTNKIEINGGVVTAHGGAWAAGIGEGDSVDGAASNLFNSEENTYEVVINGGVVTAYGGYSAAAIGTTDAITNGNSFSVGTTSGLSITITGGNITATSGETSTDSLTAAIGAGQNTDMEDNSITIYNEAKIVAASFSRYAISNYGYSTDTPSVNIDPEGYVYLARFGSVTKERTFKVYAIHKNANGHFMYVPTASHDISDGSIDSATMPYYYAYDPGHVSSDGTRIGGFYLVDKDGANVVPSDYADNPEDYLYDKDTKRYYPTTIPAVSAYYDTETIIEEITVPGNYKAVAITLPNPNEYGGSYVLEVPQASGNPIYVLMQKDHPGVTSGEVENASQTHYSAGSNPPSEANSTPNITIDGTARPFTDLDVGIYEGGVAQPTLIPEFTDTVYGYTFYVPHGTECFWLDFSFASSYTDEYGKAVSAKIILLTLDGVNQGFDSGATSISLSDLNIGSDGRADVWIKKTDTTIASGSTKTVSYKITLIIKDRYSFLLNLEALDKVYDGIPVDPSFKALIDGETVSDTKYERNPFKTTYGTETYTLGNTIAVKVNNTTISYSISSVSFDKTSGIATYTATFSYRRNNNSTPVTTDVEFTVNQQGSLKFLTSGTQELTINNNNSRVQITKNDDNDTITLQYQTYSWSWWEENWNDSGSAVPLKITKRVDDLPPSSLEISDAEIAAEEARLKEKLETSGEYSVSGTISKSQTGTTVYSATLGEGTGASTATYSVPYTSSCSVKITVFAAGGKNYTDMMTLEEKEAVVYTFYQDKDGDDVYETSLGTERPKNAGHYKIVATLDAAKYEAEGSANFVISKKEINLIAIENWLKYVTSEEVKTYDGVISDPGEIYFDGVVSGESVALLPGATFKYFDTGNAGYADDVSYDGKKIIITNPVLNAASQINYILVGVTDGVCRVHGQIAYSTSGTMFRKADAANTSLWRKFYPIEADDYLTWVTSGGAFTDTRVDYHSPVPNGASADNGYSGGTVGIHREYVKLRTTGDTSERYSVDIEFGAMQFEYTKTIWNVNTGEYEAVEGESKWNGHDGTNNAVTVTNRSNSEIYYQLEFNIDFMYAAISAGADSGIRAALYDTNYALVAGTQVGEKITSTSGKSAVQALLSAAPPDPTGVGTAHSKTYLLVLSGVPSSITEGNTLTYTNVGSVTVEIIELTP